MPTSFPFLPVAATNCGGPGGKSVDPWPRPATVSSPTIQQLSNRDVPLSIVRRKSTMTSSGIRKIMAAPLTKFAKVVQLKDSALL
eukprot:6768364-Alexandrium_andersonii.AAC.1